MRSLVLAAVLALPACASSSSSPTTDAPREVAGGMLDVPAGTFTMGCNEAVDAACNADEKPAHAVTLRAFAIDRLETTQREYQACIAAGACTAPTQDFDPSGHADYPVAWITWDQARAYCTYRGKRLPTEAEWERAARGTDGRLYPWGDAPPSCTLASFAAAAPRDSSLPDAACRSTTDRIKTDLVGSHPSAPSAAGALDMGGNLWEWVSDFYDPGYYAASPASDPTGPPTGAQHAKRGGSWQDSADRLRASRRWTHPLGTGAEDIGVRCAR